MDVLVTGSKGAIGKVAVAALRARGHRVRGFDRGEEDGPDGVRGDLTDRAAVERAVAGTQAVLHLAATPDEADPIASIIPNNIAGLCHVLEAARARGARRVVVASSLRSVMGGWDHDSPLPADRAPHPHDFYSWSKGAGELLARLYGERLGLSILVARICFFPRDRREWAWTDDPRHPHLRRTYLSRRDAERWAVAAIEAEARPGYGQMHVVSRGAEGLLDLDAGERLIGWRPRDLYPAGSPEITGA